MATATLNTTRTAGISRLQMIALVIGVIGIGLLAVGFFIDTDQFIRSYLFGYYLMVGLPIGCLGALMVQHLTGGVWGVTARRLLEAGTLTWPIVGLLFIPILLAAFHIIGDHHLYEWANPEVITPGASEYDPIIAHKVPWLSPEWFGARAVIYFVSFTAIAYTLRNWSLKQDNSKTREEAVQFATYQRMLSGFGVLLLVLNVTFMSFDWTMSLDPHWFSTMYGAHYLASSVLMTIAFMIIMIRLLKGHPLVSQFETPKPMHDLGKLMLAFTILWTYMSYGQYVIIWSGDVAEFTPWFLKRTTGGWEFFVPVLMILAFFAPFFALLSRRNKRNPNVLPYVAAFVIIMRFVDFSWVTLPYFHETVGQISWMDAAAPLGLVGIWVALFINFLQRAPALPVKDPNMDLLGFHASHGGHH